jgi:hypothetical protein
VPHEVGGLLKVLAGARRLLVVIHDNPDPDALASACALQRLAWEKFGIHSRICCEPIAGRAENRALIRELRLNLLPVSRVDWGRWPLIACSTLNPAPATTRFRRGACRTSSWITIRCGRGPGRGSSTCGPTTAPARRSSPSI